MKISVTRAVVPLVVLVTACCVSALTAGEVDFNRDVRQILANNCYECHGPDEESRQGELRLDQFGEHNEHVLSADQPDESPLIERLLSDDEDLVMPPPEAHRRPTAEQIETLRRWVEQGADYQPHWAFVKPTRPELPPVADTAWPRNPIDRFVLSHLEARSLKPRPDADPRVLARRLSLALTGLPLLPEQGDRFTKAYQANPEQAISDLVDILLADQAYGEHFAATWLDAARYADTNGYQGDGPRVMWPWRDWLVRSLNANVTFDQLTEEMLAGDLLLPQKHAQWETADWIAEESASNLLLATGFLRNHRYDTGSGTIPEESKFENAADRMETVGTVWMGLTLQCARCHTHKFDPVENHEYYQLLSFFDKAPEVGSALKDASHPYIHTPTGEQRDELIALQAAAAETEQQFTVACKHLGEAQTAWEKKLENAADPSRVSRGMKFQFVPQPVKFHGRNSIKKTNKPIALCAGNKTWTISFWFRPQSRADGAIFSSVEEPERYRPGIQADWIGGKVRVRHVCRWVNSYIEFESRKKLAVGKWHHVTFRCDGRMQGLAYRASLGGSDTAMICTHPVTNDSAGNSGKAPLVLGGSPLLKGLVGQLRDLRFYDRTLAADEVASLADARTTAAIAAIPPADRTAGEARTLRLAFLESDALLPRAAELQQLHFDTQQKLAEAIRETPTTMVMRDVPKPPTRIRLAGVYDSLGEAVSTDTPAFLPPLSHETADRLSLARWLTHPDHPLTARVAVNRIWQTLWGRGFVDSPENFGTQCGKPEHAELLDWLATEYVRSGWDTKQLVKLIVTSRAYRQSSAAEELVWKTDPDNRRLARGPRFRLPVHVVRDQALYLSGRLDRTIGGPPVILDEVRGKDGKPQKLPYEVANNRRTLYTFWKRNSPHPVLAVFDAADRNQCDVRVRRTNTPLQALVTLNESGFAAAAKSLGQRAKAAGDTEAAGLSWIWQACTGRVTEEEDMAYLQAALAVYRRESNGDEDAAWTALANVMLNLDATMSLE